MGRGWSEPFRPWRGTSFSLRPWPLLGVRTHIHTPARVHTSAYTPSAYSSSSRLSHTSPSNENQNRFLPTLKPPVTPSCFHNRSRTPCGRARGPSCFPSLTCHFCPHPNTGSPTGPRCFPAHLPFHTEALPTTDPCLRPPPSFPEKLLLPRGNPLQRLLTFHPHNNSRRWWWSSYPPLQRRKLRHREGLSGLNRTTQPASGRVGFPPSSWLLSPRFTREHGPHATLSGVAS